MPPVDLSGRGHKTISLQHISTRTWACPNKHQYSENNRQTTDKQTIYPKHNIGTLLNRCTLNVQLRLTGHGSFACKMQYFTSIVYDSFRYDNVKVTYTIVIQIPHIACEANLSVRRSYIFCVHRFSSVSLRIQRIFFSEFIVIRATVLRVDIRGLHDFFNNYQSKIDKVQRDIRSAQSGKITCSGPGVRNQSHTRICPCVRNVNGSIRCMVIGFNNNSLLNPFITASRTLLLFYQINKYIQYFGLPCLIEHFYVVISFKFYPIRKL